MHETDDIAIYVLPLTWYNKGQTSDTMNYDIY